jgi:hypothetical protein
MRKTCTTFGRAIGRSKSMKTILRLSVVLVFGSCAVIGGLSADNGIKPRSILTASDVADRAVEYLGFGPGISRIRTSAVTVTDTSTPFLRQFINGRRAWKVTFSGLPMNVLTPLQDTAAANAMEFEVLIDSLSGKLLSITYEDQAVDTVNCPYLAPEEAERQILNDGEHYLGIPSEPPKFTFLDVAAAFPHSILDAKRVVAQYVWYSQDHIDQETGKVVTPDSMACWIISLVGIPPIEPRGGPADRLPVYTCNRIRQVVNAETGRILFKSTTPSVPLSEDDRKRILDGED